MRILLSDGSGLTSRQVATRLAAQGHHVSTLAPSSLVLTRFTRTVKRVHHVPSFGEDPWGWFRTACQIARSDRSEVLFPTQEQVALLSCVVDRLAADGIGTAVPTFEALRRVQDKISATMTLAELDLPTPPSAIASTHRQLLHFRRFPVYVKAPIGTASASVVRVDDAAAMPLAAERMASVGAFEDGGVVVQDALSGPLLMIQSVFDGGRLVASHANLRIREGAGGGAASKQSVDLPQVREDVSRLGSALRWHGALSLDAIWSNEGVRYIDVNPRLVEPINALRSGTDLVGAMLALCRGEHPPEQLPGRPDVRTHQLLLALLRAAEQGGRLRVGAELIAAARRTGPYANSVEELTPMGADVRSSLPIAAATIAVLARPSSFRLFAGSAVSAYALTPIAWRKIISDRNR